MSRLALTLQNRQTTRPVDLRVLRQILWTLLRDLLCERAANLGVYLVAAPEMARLNETFLRHAGSTDVITFDYGGQSEGGPVPGAKPPPGLTLHGEILICVDEAVVQARRFRTTWTAEVVRYAVHGMLHLRGFDDARTSERLRMRREEERLLGELASRFDLTQLTKRQSGQIGP